MRPQPVQGEDFGIVEIVDQQPIGFDVAFPEALPFAREHVGSVPDGQRVIVHQYREDGIQFCNGNAALQYAFVVFFEGSAELNPAHGLRLCLPLGFGGKRRMQRLK